jgi:hypothetical protein
VRNIGLCAAAVLFAGGLVTASAPEADATLCGSVGGRHVDVRDCAATTATAGRPAAATTSAPASAGVHTARAERRRVRKRRQAHQRQRLHLTVIDEARQAAAVRGGLVATALASAD